ncbi:50S ribosomal protein L3 [Candidatus Bandiella numerosa]|jgi:large subunit ribosomal protein L3|uniref:50S ribosomal protein L3 n=1 Tax=Candidatus Bandiella numerosa TaxID=2570586 RepID=UPI00249EB031|nr:50S ribosomal protein L3 [Candidatus Bandiella numerosa]WHA05315.1 50S ribosomal protein L3 [Candidatus Bandiella numerosa]
MKESRCGVIAKKIGMTQIFKDNGEVIPVTVLHVDENVVLSVKNEEKNGYDSLQIAAFDQKMQRLSKSIRGIFEKAKVAPKKKIKEFSINKKYALKVGDVINVNHFKKGQYVDITGTSIGKGYAGVMKRHNFKGLEASHGVSISHRSAGSTGQCQDPGKVFKGKKMAGRLGGEKVTKQNILIVDIDSELNVLLVKGAVPGNKNGYLYIRDAIKKALPC